MKTKEIRIPFVHHEILRYIGTAKSIRTSSGQLVIQGCPQLVEVLFIGGVFCKKSENCTKKSKKISEERFRSNKVTNPFKFDSLYVERIKLTVNSIDYTQVIDTGMKLSLTAYYNLARCVDRRALCVLRNFPVPDRSLRKSRWETGL